MSKVVREFSINGNIPIKGKKELVTTLQDKMKSYGSWVLFKLIWF